MTRMSREFSLVLLGAGILGAGYFAAPSPAAELEQKAEEQAATRTGHSTHRSHAHVPLFLFLHSPGYAGGRPGAATRSPAMPSVSRGGFGGVGHATGAGSAS